MNRGQITSAIVSPAPRSQWAEVYAADPLALPFQSPRWIDGLCRNPKYSDASRLYVTGCNRIVVPLVERQPFPGLSVAESLPHGFGAGGWVSEHPISSDEINNVMRDLAQTAHSVIRLRPNPVAGDLLVQSHVPGWRTVMRRGHVLDLTGGFDTVWTKRIRGEKRNKVRKGIKAGLTLDVGNSTSLLAEYYDVYMRWCSSMGKRQHMPQVLQQAICKRREPLWKFENAASTMGDSFKICIARHNGRAVAGAILLIGPKAAVYWRSASDPDFAVRLAANDFLQRHMIEMACIAGCDYYHMGESGGVSSLEQFKESYGAKAFDYLEYTRELLPLTRAGHAVGIRFGQLARAWRN